MHTDEYEISIGREIALCRRMVRQLKDSLERREKQCGMTTAAFLQALEEGCLSEQHPIQSWNPRISKVEVLAKDVERIRRSPGEPQTALRQPGTLQEGDRAVGARSQRLRKTLTDN